MLALLTDKPFNKPGWIFEVKYDGYRAMALCNGGGHVDLYSRNFLSFNEAYPTVAAELSKIAHSCLLDGEVVVEDAKGRSGFQLLQGFRQTGGALKYYVFDLLNLDGNDITGMPLHQRKELLKLLLRNGRKMKNIIFSEHIKENGTAFFKVAIKRKLEGIIAKNEESIYHPGKRTGDWLKIKITNEQEAIIVGITAPKGGRSHFGSLLLGAYKGKDLKYIGRCGTGFDEKDLESLYKTFKPFFTDRSPFKEKISVPGEVTWIRPKFVCHVKFTEWTKDGSMRHPVFMGMRKDKKATEVVIEKIK